MTNDHQTRSSPDFLAGPEWFHVAEVEPGVHVIAEPGHVRSWLISGSDRQILLDTGLGIADVRAAMQGVATAEPLVVNSHVHYDHVGGNHLFARTAMHANAPRWIASGCDPALREAHAAMARATGEAWERLVAADREFFFLIGPDETMRPWPDEQVRERGWNISPAPADQLLEDGDRLDLGDRELHVLHTPGHAPDHICLLDEHAGILWAQDHAYYGPQLICLEGSDITAFATSLRSLADRLRGAIRTVYTAHCLRQSVPPRFLGELADAAEAVAAGEAATEPAGTLPIGDVVSANFGHFSIVVPALGGSGRG